MVNIMLPIITNLIIVMILLAGIFIGRKNGWKIELAKLVLVLGAGVASYFLTPIITDLVMQLTFVNDFMTQLNLIDFTLHSTCFALIFMTFYLFISIICLAIRGAVRTVKGPKVAKQYKVKTHDRKADRRARKEQKKLKRLRKEQRDIRKRSKVIGAIIGLFVAILVGFVIMLPMKDALISISKSDTELTKITNAYDYTIYGVIDEHVYNVSEVIINN